MKLTLKQESILCFLCPSSNPYWGTTEWPDKDELKMIRKLQRMKLVHLHHGHWRTTVKGKEIVLGWMADDI